MTEGAQLVRKGRIIMLNGVGSAGKSSIAKALQTIAGRPWLHVQMDAFLEMLPEAWQDHPESFAYKTIEEDGKPSVAITGGPVGLRLMRGMRAAIAALAEAGNDLIIDDVMIEPADKEAYAKALTGFDVFRVGVHAPLALLEERERQRPDRLPGTSRWQFDRVHRDMRYDLEVDTSRMTAMECADAIKRALGM
jgi:chloramphenicol 3-O phosphotransferase